MTKSYHNVFSRQFIRFLVCRFNTSNFYANDSLGHDISSQVSKTLFLAHIQSTTLIKKPNSGSITCHLYDHASSLTLHGVRKSHAQEILNY